MNPSHIAAPARLDVTCGSAELKASAADPRGRKVLHQLLDVADRSIEVHEHNLRVTRALRAAVVAALGEVAA